MGKVVQQQIASEEGLPFPPAARREEPSGMRLSWPCRRLVPFVINAQAGQPGYRVPLKQLLQADHTLTRVFSQHVICKGGTGESGRRSATGRQAAENRRGPRTGRGCSGHPPCARCVSDTETQGGPGPNDPRHGDKTCTPHVCPLKTKRN